MDLYSLLKKCNIHIDKSKIKNHLVKSIENNSHKVSRNDIFIAIKGENRDGHEFINEAVRNDAKTIIYEDKFYHHVTYPNVNMIKVQDTKKVLANMANYYFKEPSKKLNMIGVTGTNGKTTVTTLIYELYKSLEEKSTLIGTTGIKVGETQLDTDNTTPSSLVLHKLFSDSLNQDIKNVVMEVSSHAIKQQRVGYIDFDTVIYTNFSHDHLDYHKTFDDYFYTKGLLFSHLGNYFNGKKVLLNGDDKYYKKFLALTNVKSYTYGIDEDNDFQAKNIICDIDKIVFDFYAYNEFLGSVNTKNIFGFFNVYNLLAVISYFYIHNYEMDKVFKNITTLNCVTGRMEKVSNPYHHVFVDYAHTPDSVYRILNEVKMITKRNIICVIGCGGNRDTLKRPIIGKMTTSLASYVIFTSDNPRKEEPSSIINDIIKGACHNNYIAIENRSKAIKFAIDSASESDVIVILGKGHENYQIINDEKIYFSDYDEVLKYINMRYKVGQKEMRNDY